MRRQSEASDPELLASQLRAVEALLIGSDIEAAALAAGADPETVRDWADDDPGFIACLNRAKRERARRIRAEVHSLASEAVETLRDAMTNPESPMPIRFRAALAVLEATNTMSAETIGPVSANGVQAALDRERLIDSLGG
jgi:hypothetical protein